MTNIGIVRAPLFAGPLIFGLVSLYIRTTPDYAGIDSAAVPAIRIAAYALIPLACGALLLLRTVRSAARNDQRVTLSIAGWGAAELPALVGAVLIYAGGEIWPWLAGLAVMIVSWQLLPSDPSAD